MCTWSKKIRWSKKINFSFDNTEKYIIDFGNKMPLSKPSMLQDVEAKRKFKKKKSQDKPAKTEEKKSATA